MLPVPKHEHDLMSIEESMIRNQARAFSDGSSDGSAGNYEIHQKLINMARHLSNETTSTPLIPNSPDEVPQGSEGYLRTPTKETRGQRANRMAMSSGKALSLEKDGTEFSLSSDPVDLREEN